MPCRKKNTKNPSICVQDPFLPTILAHWDHSLIHPASDKYKSVCFPLDLPSPKDIIVLVVEKSKCLSVGGKFGLRQLQWTVVRYRNLKTWEIQK